MSKTVYAILGDYYHDHDLAFNALKKATEGQDIELHDAEIKDMDEILSQKPNLIVLDKENRLNPVDEEVKYWMNTDAENGIARYVASGGAWLAWHAGLASYPTGGAYHAMLRGFFKYHPSKNKTVKYIPFGNALKIYKPEEFSFIDEHYFVECDETNTNVFLLSESDDGTSVAGWAHSYENGRVCCITPAHRAEGLLHPKMIELLSECVKWCLNGK